MRQVLELAKDDTQALVESLKYLVSHQAGAAAVSALQAALLQHSDGLDALIESIANEGELIEYLSYKSLARELEEPLKKMEPLQKYVGSALVSNTYTPLEAAMVLCRLNASNGETFLRPGRLDSYRIGDMLEYMSIPATDFFPRVAEQVVLGCLAYTPQNRGQAWLSTFLYRLIDHYGHPAQTWIADQVARCASQPEFWKIAIERLVDDDPASVAVLELTSGQRAWLRDARLERVRRELENQMANLSHHPRPGMLVVHSPLVLTRPASRLPGGDARLFRSWLRSEAAETAIYSWFDEVASDLQDHYSSPEDGLTSGLCTFLQAHASKYQPLIDAAWRARHPTERLQMNIAYFDCRKGRDVGGADLALILSVNAADTYTRSSFAAFQCKKIRRGSLPFSKRETVQMGELRSFTHASYYLLYPCGEPEYPATGPVVVSARTVDGLLRARHTSTIDRSVLLEVGHWLGEYFVSDLLPGWSGDERWETRDDPRGRRPRASAGPYPRGQPRRNAH